MPPRPPRPKIQLAPRPAPVEPKEEPSDKPKRSLAEDHAASMLALSIKDSERRVAACVQAANELIALKPMLLEHRHGMTFGASRGPHDASSTGILVVSISIQNTTQRDGTAVPAVAELTAPASATYPSPVGLLAKLAQLEVRLGSLRALAGELDALAQGFREHIHPYPFQWGPALATLEDANRLTCIHAFPPQVVTAKPSSSAPAGVDGQATLPYPGAPSPHLPLEERAAVIASVTADLEPLYARVSSVARAYPEHVHPAVVGGTNVATLVQPLVHPSMLVGWFPGQGAPSTESGLGRRR